MDDVIPTVLTLVLSWRSSSTLNLAFEAIKSWPDRRHLAPLISLRARGWLFPCLGPLSSWPPPAGTAEERCWQLWVALGAWRKTGWENGATLAALAWGSFWHCFKSSELFLAVRSFPSHLRRFRLGFCHLQPRILKHSPESTFSVLSATTHLSEFS